MNNRFSPDSDSFCRIVLLAVLLSALFVGPLGAKAHVPGRGMLLVAQGGLVDPRFHESVVLILQHDSQGSVGLIVNRRSELSLLALFPDLPIVAEGGKTLSYGGPVAPDTLLVLVHAEKDPPKPAQRITKELFVTGITELSDYLDKQEGKTDFLVFTGYAGWSHGQLDAEVGRGDWLVIPVDAGELFANSELNLWERLVR